MSFNRILSGEIQPVVYFENVINLNSEPKKIEDTERIKTCLSRKGHFWQRGSRGKLDFGTKTSHLIREDDFDEAGNRIEYLQKTL